MNRTDRLTAILLHLQQRGESRRQTAEEIAALFEVSRRTVLRDVQALAEMGVPVISQEGAGGGYSLAEKYSVPPIPLTLREAVLLLMSLNALESLADTPYAVERGTLLTKLKAVIPARHRAEAESWMNTLAIEMPRRRYTVPFVELLVECARLEQWVRVTYRSAGGESEQTLLPKQITSRGGFWYCSAFSLERGEERNYRVDRFVSAHMAEAPSEPIPAHVSLPYAHSSHPEVVIHLTSAGVMQAERDPHSGFAITMNADGTGKWQFRCPPSDLDWLARFVLSLGADAEVDSPAELIGRVRTVAEATAARYAPKS